MSAEIVDYSKPALVTERDAMMAALTAAGAAFEMLRPENHQKASDSELAELIVSADRAVHAVLELGRSRQ